MLHVFFSLYYKLPFIYKYKHVKKNKTKNLAKLFKQYNKNEEKIFIFT